ncbi:MAG: hypothetical protein Q9167_005307 [Letrouitia subvulpina]
MAQPSAVAPALKPPDGLTSNFEAPSVVAKWNALHQEAMDPGRLDVFLCLGKPSTGLSSFLLANPRFDRRVGGHSHLFCPLDYIHVSLWRCASMECPGVGTEPAKLRTWFNLITVVYGPGMLCTKLAILLLYRRVFMPHKLTLFDWVTRVFMAILCAFYFASTVAKIWECTPRSKIWNKKIPGHCVDRSKLFLSSGIFNTVTDFIILLIPVQAVWKLKMDTKRKLGIILVFTIGLTAPVFSIVGLVVRLRISNDPDATYNQPKIYLWALAELTAGLICACIPILATLINRRRLAQQRQYIPDKKYSSNRAYPLRTKPNSTSLEGESLFDPTTLELAEASCPTIPVIAVKSGAKSGADRSSSDQTERDAEVQGSDQEGNKVVNNRILKTVRVEQTFA